MEEFILYPDNCSPLRFNGTLVAEHSTRDENSTRWIETTVYRTDHDAPILSIKHATRWMGEKSSSIACVFNSFAATVTHLEKEHPPAAAAIAKGIKEAHLTTL